MVARRVRHLLVVFGSKCGVCGRGRCGVRGGKVLEDHFVHPLRLTVVAAQSSIGLRNVRVKGDEEDGLK